MKVELYPKSELVRINRLPEVTNPIIFEMGVIPTSDGLLSREIFGNTSNERKNTIGWINLNGHFFNPYVYKLIKRMDAKIDHVIYGSKTFIIKDGALVEDENGETGIEWLYDNWEKIKFKRNDSTIRNERIDLIEYYGKDVIFQTCEIVLPPFYRDVNSSEASTGKVRPHIITKMYAKLITCAKTLKGSSDFDFKLNNTRGMMQAQLVEIYDYFKSLQHKKDGIIRKNLMGKSISYGSRCVITAPVINSETYDTMRVCLGKSAIPLAQVCAMMAPFIISWTKRFFEVEIEKMGAKYPVRKKTGEIVYYKLQKPELYFTDTLIRKQLNRYVRSVSDRFEKVELPLVEGQTDKKVYLSFVGRYYEEGKPETESELFQRPATWTDIFYQAAVECAKGKHQWITRYPILDVYGTFPSQIEVLSTKNTKPVYIGNTLYPHYPIVDLTLSKHDIEMVFDDTITMSNTYLKGLGGDYDGDQISDRIVFSQQANQEAEEIIYSKQMLIGYQGQNMRTSTNECIQALYHLTKNPDNHK